MHCVSLHNHRLQAYVNAVGPAGLFSRYVVRRKPDSSSLAVLHRNQVLGTAISGQTAELWESYPYWVFANTPDAAAVLAHALGKSVSGLNVPLHYVDIFQTLHPDRSLSVDRLYALPPSRFQDSAAVHPVVQLSTALLRDVHIEPELHPLLGNLEHWHGETRLYGIVQNSLLVCIGDIMVQDAYLGAIQQLYTLASHRGQGLARSLVTFLARTLLQHQKLPLYVVAEDNLPSRRIAETAGFMLDSCWGYFE